MYDLYIGTEVGLLKGLNLNLEKDKLTNINKPNEIIKENNEGIVTMMFSKPRKAEITMALKNNHLVKYDCQNHIFKNNLPYDFGPGLKNIAYYSGATVSACSSGDVKVWKKRQVIAEVNAGQNLYVMRNNPFQQNHVATGGEENELKVWDLNKFKEPFFKAKNVSDDYLRLRMPVSIREITFYDEKKVITGTKYHQIRLYDLAISKRKPVIDIEFDEYPVSSISLAHNEYQIVAGNNHGRLALIDLRKKTNIVHAFKKIPGAIRDVKVHPTKPLVFASSLDNMIRIYDLFGHELIERIYAKSPITCMLLDEKATD